MISKRSNQIIKIPMVFYDRKKYRESHQKVSKSLHQNEASSQRCTELFRDRSRFLHQLWGIHVVAQRAPKPKKDAIVFVCHQSWDGK